MQCMACHLRPKPSVKAQYAFVLVFGSDGVKRVADRVRCEEVSMVPGCSAYCCKCKRVCRLMERGVDATEAMIRAKIVQDGDCALFECMQRKQIMLY